MNQQATAGPRLGQGGARSTPVGAESHRDRGRRPRRESRSSNRLAVSMVLAISAVAVSIPVAAWMVELPILARGQARVVAEGATIAVEAEFRGRVVSIDVALGQIVSPGDIMARLINIDLESDAAGTHSQKAVVDLTVSRLSAELENARTFAPRAPSEIPDGFAELVEAEIAAFKASATEKASRIAQFAAARNKALAEADLARTTVAGLRLELRLLEEQMSVSRDTGRGSRSTELELARQRASLERRLNEATGAAAVAAATAEDVDKERAIYLAERNKRITGELTTARRELARLSQIERAARERTAANQLIAPAAGIVVTIDADPGSVMNPGDRAVGIVPLTDKVAVDVEIPAQDIAGVRSGLPAVMRLDAIPFEVHGGLQGQVQVIAPDTVEDSRTGQRHFKVRVSAERRLFETDRGAVAVTPGMSGIAEIVVGRRSVAAYILRPLEAVIDTAWRE